MNKEEIEAGNKLDFSIKENQIGCGYCMLEGICKIRSEKVNTAKLGCPYFRHYSERKDNEQGV